MMQTINETEGDYDALFAALEIRYGTGPAQSVIDEIKKADRLNQPAGALLVKALGDALQDARAELRELVAACRLQQTQRRCDQKIIDLAGRQLRRDLDERFWFYSMVSRAYYRSYKSAMAAYVDHPWHTSRPRFSAPERLKMAA